jgi:tRNA U54 and U55 pseudouridine synthase Pus10
MAEWTTITTTAEDVIKRFIDRVEEKGASSITYVLRYPENQGVFYQAGTKYVTEMLSYNGVVERVKEEVERRFGKLQLEKTFGLRVEVWGNEDVMVNIDPGWGTLIIDVVKRQRE